MRNCVGCVYADVESAGACDRLSIADWYTPEERASVAPNDGSCALTEYKQEWDDGRLSTHGFGYVA